MTDNLELINKIKLAANSLGILALSSGENRNIFLASLAAKLKQNINTILDANLVDLNAAKEKDYPAPLIDRLALNEKRVAELAQGLLNTATLPDPLGQIEDYKTLSNGLMVGRLRVPLGLIAFICEARPGAVAEAAAMAIKSGNGIIIKPGREALETTSIISSLIGLALVEAGLPPAAVTIIPTLNREDLKEILAQDDLIDLVIPRGGEALIRFVSENTRIPILKHFKGVCHLYVDNGADLNMAKNLVINGKTQRPGTCNALECLLVNKEVALQFLTDLGPSLTTLGVEMAACPRAIQYLPGARKAREDDFGREFLDLVLAIKVVDNLDEALEHIARYGSRHTEAIVTRDEQRARHFLKAADAGCVMVNASTRLNDGGCLGLGAEIGISTTKLQAYGPMGLRELTTTKFVVTGEGQIR